RPAIGLRLGTGGGEDGGDFGLAQYGFGFHAFSYRIRSAPMRRWVASVQVRSASSALLHRLLDNLDPMLDRRAPGAVQVGLAADVGGDDHLRLAAFQGVELVVAQLLGNLRLGQRITAR